MSDNFTPSSGGEVNDRIAAKKEAFEAIKLLNSLSENRSFTFRARFIEAIRDYCAGVIPFSDEALKMMRVGVKAMTKGESEKFIEKEMPFGEHRGRKIEEVMYESPEYLIWLCHANDEFKNELKRFVSGDFFETFYEEHKEKVSSRKKRQEHEEA